jgi:hypothetical protein
VIVSLYTPTGAWASHTVLAPMPPATDGPNYFGMNVAANVAGDAVATWTLSECPSSSTSATPCSATVYGATYTPTNGWSSPVSVASATNLATATSFADQHVTINGSGAATVIWTNLSQQATGTSIGAASYVPGSGWTAAPARLDANANATTPFSFAPRVGMDANGNAYAVWVTGAQNETIYQGVPAATGEVWFSERRAGGSWSAPVRISQGDSTSQYPTGASFAPQLAVPPNGNYVVTWLRGNYGLYAEAYVSGSGLQPASLLSSYSGNNSVAYDLAVNAKGLAALAWYDDSTGTPAIMASQYDGAQTWSTPVGVSRGDAGVISPCGVGQLSICGPVVGIDDSGDMAVSWTQYAYVQPVTGPIVTNPGVVWSNHYVAGSGWEGPRKVENQFDGVDPIYFYFVPTVMAMDSGGDTLLLYDEFGWTSQRLIGAGPDGSHPPPVADAGANQSVAEQATVTLDGTGSSDPDGSITSYSWQQVSGPEVALSGATTATATFTAPDVIQDTPLEFRLTVTDDFGVSAAATVDVTVHILDTNGNAMSDVWEMQYFGDLTHTASGNADGDSLTNLQEFLTGGNPLDGDVNGDGKVDVADVIMVERYLLGLGTLTPDQLAAADIAPPGGDGVVNLADLVVLEQRVLAVH